MSVDEMVGTILDAITSLGIAQSTYFFYTSDNGWHLGEHRLPIFNKREPYETDVHLPLYIRGPSVWRNVTLPHPTTHIDITRTVVDIAKATAHAPTNNGCARQHRSDRRRLM